MSSIAPITKYSLPGAANTEAAANSSEQSLTQKDFLQLLVSQMKNQNPLNPQSNTEMAAQMAQFTSLQQTTEMSSSLAMMQANSLLGSTVNLKLDSNNVTSGVVEGVVLQNGTPQIQVNGLIYDVSQVISVAPTTTSQAAPAKL